MKNTVVRFLLGFLAALPALAPAAPTAVAIPGQGWQVSFDAPPWVEQKESNHSDQYMYFGNSGRFNLTIYVEKPGCRGGAANADFLDCFWGKAGRNPLIVKESVMKACDESYCKLTYDIKARWNGRVSIQKNIHFLFAYRGNWTDVQLSVVEPAEEDLKSLALFEKSLSYGAIP